jgi:acetylxylan esterase
LKTPAASRDTDMNRSRKHLLAIASIFLGLLVVAPARAATLTEVTRSTWAGSVKLPSYVKMYIYVPDKLATKPPIVVSSHACGSTASGQMGNTPKIKAAADKNGFIMILPDNPGQNCWDVGATESLTHDGGGDTQAVAQMVKYALTQYSGDATRVYAVGGSSGAMMTQALMAVYPDIFKAGSARAGVPAGCWAKDYAASNQWSGPCAGGQVKHTGPEWGDMVRAMYKGYTGHRPRVQVIQGTNDATISPINLGESVKEWTNVLGLSETPTSKDTTTTSVATYDRQFWKNTCGFTVLESWAGQGGGHSMAYEEDAILKFFGLDVAGGPDPEDAACSGDGGVPGTGGGSGSGGTTGAGGTGGARDGGSGGGAGARDAGSDLGTSSSGGVQGNAGSSGSGGAVGTGGSAAGTGGRGGTSANGGASGGAVGSGGSPGSGGTSAKGGTSANSGAPGTSGTVASSASSAKGGSSGDSSSAAQGSGGSAAQGGSTGTSVSKTTARGTSGSGCSYVIGGQAPHSATALTALLLALGLIALRRRREPKM